MVALANLWLATIWHCVTVKNADPPPETGAAAVLESALLVDTAGGAVDVELEGAVADCGGTVAVVDGGVNAIGGVVADGELAVTLGCVGDVVGAV